MREIVVVSDMHIGSDYAMWIDYQKPKSNEILRASKVQKRLVSYWQDFWKWANPYDTVMCLGDAVDGLNRNENYAKHITSTELLEQIDVCTMLLTPHVKGKTYYHIEGTGYHQSVDTSLDRAVCNRLGGIYEEAISVRSFDGVKIHATHGAGASLMYKGGAMDRESLMYDAAIGSKEIDHDVDVILAGHWHWWSYYNNSKYGRPRHIVQCPGWKLWFSIRNKVKLYGKTLPDIGGLKITIDRGEITIKEKLYPYIPVADRLEVG